ncbi:methyltransferase domain-containing protein [Thalassobius sp. I31.1]|uniref:methyltransferase domain-containing protein n=1 Tax=Thalassobius sp. I31.1 TaxID=2109912 RepID=UPI000D1B26D9|nr:methyltransferase domain-containing protein [Thalassobius sp. I31.1]
MTTQEKAIAKSETGKVGDTIKAKSAGWSFGGETPASFEDHVAKSVPLYQEGHDVVVQLSDYFLHQNSLCYEIGSSTGVLLDKVVNHNHQKNIRAVGIDVESDMVAFAKQKYTKPNISFVNADIAEFDLENADMIVSYYTLQFIKPKFRMDVLRQIYDALNWGGALLLFEKVRAPDARFQDIMSSLYIEYKIDQGYDAGEILSKSRSLKGVLEPFSTGGNLDLLRKAGFEDIMTVMKYVSFEGFLAIK